MVTAILTDEGKQVIPAQPLLNLIPEGSELQADVYLPSRAAGFVRVGTRALLQFQAFPYQKFGSHEARVVKLSRVAVAGSELPYPPPAAGPGELFYIASLGLAKSTVSAYGKEEPLQSGMGFDANLILDTRTLLEWVFEPLFSVSGNWIH
ncbi:HlyD family efflux transporter periplasmic adaptor subunit [Variovorax paradoxus]|nr:HlyD family efflux transporter periplasmic adaptor subunit [Variovorax paradoxus]